MLTLLCISEAVQRALLVNFRIGLPCGPVSLPAKNAKGITVMPSKDTPTKSGSAEPVPQVTWTLPPELGSNGVESVKAKCTPCKITTEFHWIKVSPFNVVGSSDPMEQLQLTKRLKVCTNCGTFSLTN